MAHTKKSQLGRTLTRAFARDRKRSAKKRMRVSGKSVFTLARLVGGDTAKTRKKTR